MSWFIFGGDMLVMLFMVILVVWVTAAPAKTVMDYSANIPLSDDPSDINRSSEEKADMNGEDATHG